MRIDRDELRRDGEDDGRMVYRSAHKVDEGVPPYASDSTAQSHAPKARPLQLLHRRAGDGDASVGTSGTSGMTPSRGPDAAEADDVSDAEMHSWT